MCSTIFLVLLVTTSVCPLKALCSYEKNQKSKRETQTEKTNFSLGDQCKKTLPQLKQMKIKIVEKGDRGENGFRMFFKSADGLISPLHDIPLYSNFEEKIFNMIVENPCHTEENMEILSKDPLNPIGENVLKASYIWNYGALPQTMEHPDEIDSHSGLKGDGHPMDVLDIGTGFTQRGDIIQVKVLGAFGLIIGDQIDWRIIAIDVKDSLAPILNDIGDVEKHYPEKTMKYAVDFFLFWNAWKNATSFGELKNREFALKIIEESNRKWIKLMEGSLKAPKGVSLVNTCVEGSKGKITFKEAQKVLRKRKKSLFEQVQSKWEK